jgi:hypothetical protein
LDYDKKIRNADHVRRVNRPSENNEAIETRLKELLTPSILSKQWLAPWQGLRNRILTLPVMVSVLLTLLWRQVPSVCELARLIAREDVLWTPRLNVSQQALSKRLLSFPYELFRSILLDLLPRLKQRWQIRQRPKPRSIDYAQRHFKRVLSVDGSTLEALFRKLDSLRDLPEGALAGKMCTVIDVASRLPEMVWFCEGAQAHDATFFDKILAFTKPDDLWIFDRGFYDFKFWNQLISLKAAWITRTKSNLIFEIKGVLVSTGQVRDRLITVADCPQTLRLIEIQWGKVWYRYITSVTDPKVLPPEFVADLYRRRWRIEEAFFIVKRLLNLSYLWTGSVNGVLLQVWSTWLFYAVLIDLGDDVAEELNEPFDSISLEMVFRGLYHFAQAYKRGEAKDPVKYFAAPENKDLGIVKRPNSKRQNKEQPPDLKELTKAGFS